MVIVMSTAIVKTAEDNDRARLVDVIVLAFVRDPVTRWAFPDPHQYLELFPEFVNAFGGRAFDHESAYYVDQFAGGALWLPPGVHPDEDALERVLERAMGERLQDASALFEQMARYHPTEPHWYLPLIGVDPLKQGRGCGAALLRHALEEVDRQRRPAYLESTNPANIPLYQRHGFELMGTIQVKDAPPLFPMARRAR
jgi:GNAT superfamily N-acetyltransferase